MTGRFYCLYTSKDFILFNNINYFKFSDKIQKRTMVLR